MTPPICVFGQNGVLEAGSFCFVTGMSIVLSKLIISPLYISIGWIRPVSR